METMETYAGLVTDRPAGKATTRSRSEALPEHLLIFRGLLIAGTFGLLFWAAIIRFLF